MRHGEGEQGERQRCYYIVLSIVVSTATVSGASVESCN